MGKMIRFALGAGCVCLLMVHFYGRFDGVSAMNFFGKARNERDSKYSANLKTPSHPTLPDDDGSYQLTSIPLLTAALVALVGVAAFFASRRPTPFKTPTHVGATLDINSEPALDPYDVIQCLRHRLAATETELAELKSRSTVAGDMLALVPAWSCEEQPLSVKSKGSKSVCSGQSQRSSRDWHRADLTNADYLRKCKYMAKKLKEADINVKLLRTQIAMANDIKAEFDELVEQRGDMGRQIVSLAKEKGEARRKITALQLETRTMRKQLDTSGERSALLAKHNDQLAANLKNALRDKKMAKRQFDECNDELLMVRDKLDSIHQEKERLVVRIEDLERKAAKQAEARNAERNEVGTSTSTVDIKSFERSLMNLERSVEENLRLRKSVESLYSVESFAYGAGDEKIDTIRRDLARMEELYSGDAAAAATSGETAHEMDYSRNSGTSVATSAEELADRTVSHRHRNDVSVCCLDSRCSVCSKEGCTLLHRSCSDIRCVTPYSRVCVQDGRPTSPPARATSAKRPPVIEKLADIFGNDDAFGGVTSVLNRARMADGVFTRSAGTPRHRPLSSAPKGSLTNILKDFTTSEESLASTGTYEVPVHKTSPRKQTSNKKPVETPTSPGRDRTKQLGASASHPTLFKKPGKRMVSCYTSANEKKANAPEMTGCLSLDPELGDEDVIGDQSFVQESASYVFGDRGIDGGFP